MSRDLDYLVDIVTAARLALTYIADTSEANFLEDWQVQDAVIRRLEIIGEATRRLSENARGQVPEVPWAAMIGMRNLLIHRYDDVDPLIVWQTVQEHLPPLIEHLEAALQSWEGAS